MKVSVLASGSKGNCTFIEVGKTKILIDLGVSCRYIEQKLKEIKVNPKMINAVLITHTHIDHICGLPSFYKKYKPTIYIMPKMLTVLKEYLDDFDYSFYDNNLINDVMVNIIKTSHDSEDSVGFLINNKLVYITDTGYLNQRYFKLLENKEVYIIESNHDIEMLINGKYPYHLKQRILSVKGHLSNKDASLYLSKLIGNNTKYIFLAHLSEDNNDQQTALNTLLSYIKEDMVEKIIITSQRERTELIEI